MEKGASINYGIGDFLSKCILKKKPHRMFNRLDHISYMHEAAQLSPAVFERFNLAHCIDKSNSFHKR